jgi:hypothetical protein
LLEGASAGYDEDDEQGGEEEEEEDYGLSGGPGPSHKIAAAAAAASAWAKAAAASAAGGGQPPPTKAETSEPLIRLLAVFETQLASVGPAALAREYVSALAAAPYRSALPPRVLELVNLAGQAAELHLKRKLGKRAKKLQSLLSILPVQALVGLLASKDADPGPTARSVLTLLLVRPLGGNSVLQRLTATSLGIKARERRARRLAAQLPPPLRRALAAACREMSTGEAPATSSERPGSGTDSATGREHARDRPAEVPTSIESTAALLLYHARELGPDEAVAAAAALSGPSGSAAAGCACAALAATREVQSGRAFVALLGEKAFESTLSSLLPLCAVPLLRLGLSGDIPRLVARALPAIEAMLRVVTSPALPPSQRDAMFTLAVDDLVGLVYAYAYRVAIASEAGAAAREQASRNQPANKRGASGQDVGKGAESGSPRGGGELFKLVAWATESWQRLRAPIELWLDPSGGSGELEAAVARLALAVRSDHKARGKLDPHLEAGLLASFEAQVADALGGTAGRAPAGAGAGGASL